VALPLARVKRIIRLDPDVKQTQLDAVRLISRATVRAPARSHKRCVAGVTSATCLLPQLPASDAWRCFQELFVESLAAGAYGVMRGTKRKTMKLGDIGKPPRCYCAATRAFARPSLATAAVSHRF